MGTPHSASPIPQQGYYADFVETTPKLKRLVISAADPIFLLGTYAYVAYAKKYESVISTVKATLPDRLVRVVAAETLGSFSIMALSYSANFVVIESLIENNFPLQVGDSESVPACLLWKCLQGRISPSEACRALVPMLETDHHHLIDLRAKFQPRQDRPDFPALNLLQMAFLTGSSDIINLLRSQMPEIADLDLQLLLSDGGRVSLYHAVVQANRHSSMRLNAFKLLLSRKSTYGFYPSLCFDEFGPLHLNVMESLVLDNTDPASARFLYEQGIDPAPKVYRHWKAPPSILNVFFHNEEYSRSVDVLDTLHPILMDPRVYTAPNLLDGKFQDRGLLAQVARSNSTQVMNRLLLTATQAQKDLALLEIADSFLFNRAQEKLLLASGANPVSVEDENGLNAMAKAARAGRVERVLFFVQGHPGWCSTPNSRGSIAMDFALAHCCEEENVYPDVFDMLHALAVPPEIRANFKPTLRRLLEHVKMRAAKTQDQDPAVTRAAAKLKPELEKLVPR